MTEFETKSLSKAEWLRRQEKACDEKGWTECRDHHVLSDKHKSYFTPLFEKELDKIGMSLSDPANICKVCDNGDGRRRKRRHPDEYHRQMLDAIVKIINDKELDDEAKRRAVRELMLKVCEQLNMDSDLRRLVTRP